MIKHLMVCCLDYEKKEEWMDVYAAIPSTVDSTDIGVMMLLSKYYPMVYADLQVVAELDENDNARLIWCSDYYAHKLRGRDLSEVFQ